ncbi:M56 family metallopeptidase [Bacteroidota bacterium]
MSYFNLLLDKPVIDALGWTLVHSIWQIALWAIVAVSAMVMSHRNKAKIRYSILGIILFCICLTSVVTFGYHYNNAKVNNTQNQVTTNENVVTDNAEENVHESNNIHADQAQITKKANLYNWFYSYFDKHLPAIVSIWFLGFIFLFLRYAGGMAWMLRLRSTANPLKKSFQRMVYDLSLKIGISRIVLIASHIKIKTPVVIGHFKPVILFPISIITGLSNKEIESILLHELAHIKRNDFIVNLIQSFLEVVFFYHPALWWISSVLKTEREHACDDLAIKHGANIDSMASSITEIASLSINQSQYSVAFSGKQHKLKERINRLILKETMKTNMKQKLFVAMIILIATATLSFTVSKEFINYSDTVIAENKTDVVDKTQEPDKPEIITHHELQQKQEQVELEEMQRHELEQQKDALKERIKNDLDISKEIQKAKQLELDGDDKREEYIEQTIDDAIDDAIDEAVEKAIEEDKLDNLDEILEDAIDDAIKEVVKEIVKEEIKEAKEEDDDDDGDDDEESRALVLKTLMKQGAKEWNEYRKNHPGENFDDILKESNLAGMDLSNFDLSFINLKEANLKGVNFTNANMEGVNIKEAYVIDAIFKNANLARANMKELEIIGCNLQKANLTGANMKEVTAVNSDFSGAILSGAVMYEATIKSCNLKGAVANHATSFPLDLNIEEEGIVIK